MSQNRADFEQRQETTIHTIAKISANLDLLTNQLNHLKPASGSDVESLQEKLTQQVTEKLSASDKRVQDLSVALEDQKKNIADNSGLLKDLLIGIKNLGENLKSINQELDS